MAPSSSSSSSSSWSMLVISLILVVNADTGWMLDSMGEAC
jgi:hypothetical protein